MKKTITFLLVVIISLKKENCQNFRIIIDDSVYLDNIRQPFEKQVKFASQQKINRFSVWGWFQFQGETTMESNIISIFNNKKISSNSDFVSKSFNPKFARCLYLKTYLQLNPSLYRDKEIFENPNCSFEEKSITLNNYDESIFYLNFKREKDSENFSLFFFFQNGLDEKGVSVMRVEKLENLSFENKVWNYFSIRFDYLTTNFEIYIKNYNQKTPFDKNLAFNIFHENFLLGQEIKFILGSNKKNPYFNQELGFIGEIAYVNFINSVFEHDFLQHLWVSFISDQNLLFEGLLIEIKPDFNNDSFTTNGVINQEYKIENFINNQNINKQSFFELKSKNWIELKDINFFNNKMIKSFSFYFEFSYKDGIDENYFFFSRGKDSENGSIVLTLKKKQQSDSFRFFNLNIVGSGDVKEWTIEAKIIPDKTIWVMISISISPANSIQATYFDSNNNSLSALLTDNLYFDFTSKDIMLFKNDGTLKTEGIIYLNRLLILNNNSPFIYEKVLKKIDTGITKEKCEIYHSGYKENGICLKCKNKFVLDQDRICQNFCYLGTVNLGNNFCVKCPNFACDNYSTTEFFIEQIDENTFEIIFNDKITNFNEAKINDYFVVKINDHTRNINVFDYNVNQENQILTYEFTFQKEIKNQILSFTLNDKNDPLYDSKANLIYKKVKYTNLTNTCFIPSSNKKTIKALAHTTMALLLISIVLLLVVTIFFGKKINDILSLWKYLFFNYLKHQLVGFLVLSSIPLPCEVYVFLNAYFRVFVKCLKFHYKVFEKNSTDHPNSKQFLLEGITNYVLDNFSYGFITQIIILIFFLIMNLLKMIITQNKTLQMIIDIFNYFFMAFGYLFFVLHCFVFSFLNLRQNSHKDSITQIEIVISASYIICFIIYYIYTFVLVLKFEKQLTIIQNKKILMFLIGLKNNKISRFFDFQIFFIFLLIGLFLGVLFDFPTIQLSLILILFVIYIVCLIIQRPYIFQIWNYAEIIFFGLLILGYIFFLVLLNNDSTNCEFCAEKKTIYSYVIIFLFFFALLFCSLFLIYLILVNLILPDSYCHLYKPINYFIQDELNFKRKSIKKNFTKTQLQDEKSERLHLGDNLDIEQIHKKTVSMDFFIKDLKKKSEAEENQYYDDILQEDLKIDVKPYIKKENRGNGQTLENNIEENYFPDSELGAYNENKNTFIKNKKRLTIVASAPIKNVPKNFEKKDISNNGRSEDAINRTPPKKSFLNINKDSRGEIKKTDPQNEITKQKGKNGIKNNLITLNSENEKFFSGVEKMKTPEKIKNERIKDIINSEKNNTGMKNSNLDFDSFINELHTEKSEDDSLFFKGNK